MSEFENYVENFDQAWSNWQEAELPKYHIPPAGAYIGYVSLLRDITSYRSGERPAIIQATVDIRTIDRADKSEGDETNYENRVITWNRLSLLPRKTATGRPTLVDLLRSAKILSPPRTEEEVRGVLNELIANKSRFGFDYDWEIFCGPCYNEKLKLLAESDNEEEAKSLATIQMKRSAAAFATKLRTYRAFPPGDNGTRQSSVKCSHCGTVNEARGKIVRFTLV